MQPRVIAFDLKAGHNDRHVGLVAAVADGSTVSMADAIENQIERFATGFKDRIIKRAAHTAQKRGRP